MSAYVVTLLANALSAADVQAVADRLGAPWRWIKEGAACEMVATSASPLIDHPAFDVIIQPYPRPRYKLLITDMDSTMVECECLDELADFAGKKAEVAAITARAMNAELNFEESLIQRVALLAGMPEVTLQQCYDERVRFMPGAKALVSHMKSQGAHTVLISGGFDFFTSRVRAGLGMDEDVANRLEIKDDRLTGRVILPIIGKEAKLATLQAQCKKLGISAAEVMAIGDGANDVPMLLAAGLGVAYHAKPAVRAQVKAQINHGDLSALIAVNTK